jgi:hypothetical protein
VKRFALGERGDIVQPGTLAKASAALKRTANKPCKNLTQKAERKISARNNRQGGKENT